MMRHSLLVFAAYVLLLCGLLFPHSALGQFTCTCRCCIGNGCTASVVGTPSVSSCSSCSSTCEGLSECPAGGQSGSRSSTCSSSTSSTDSPTTSSVDDSDIWSGTYTVGNQCDTSTCCCLTGNAVVVQSGVSVTINSPVEGACGSATSTTLSIELPSASSTSADFTSNGQSFTASISGDTVIVTNNDASQCSNSAVRQSSTTQEGTGQLCFHEDTQITYKGETLNLAQLRDHQECHIPHVVRSAGLKLHATCPDGDHVLRLTDGHLVFTQEGIKAAVDVVQGKDVLFADMKESTPCEVTRVEREDKVQNYFGLNCLHSEVLAEGLKASTFEKLHMVPATWMNTVGSGFGIKAASYVGELLADFALSMNLV